MTIYILLFYYVTFSLMHEGTSHRPWYSEECKAWSPVIKHIEEEDPKLQVTCNKNEECTGIQCRGKYIYKGQVTFGQTFEADICFGMSVMPCDEPVDLFVYVVVPQYKKRVERVVNGSKRFKIQGLEIPVSKDKDAVAVPYIRVDMNRTSDPRRMMQLQMRLEVEIRQKYSKGKQGKATRVRDLEIDLVPGSIIPIPDCDKHVINPDKGPASCNVGVVKTKKSKSKPKLIPQRRTKPKATSKSSTSKPKLIPQRRTKPKATSKSSTNRLPGTKCKDNPDSLLACGYYQYCTEQHVCVCLDRYKYDNASQSCVDPTNTTPVPSPTSQPLSTSIKLIASCGVLAGVILVIIIALIIVYKYRKRRSRYQQHDMLLNNDDDDDDVDPIT